ncbi:MAG: hypothetical protein LBK06_08885 [Planctomycetaceae bacterium]|nr:hypothetical protein [Planctomycetaceae bacterium]
MFSTNMLSLTGQENDGSYTEAGKAIGFALEQPLHVVALPCSALRIFSVYFKTASAYY